MKKITDADVTAFLHRRHSSATAPKKKGMDGLERPTGGGYNITSAAIDILQQANGAWNSLRVFRRQADRCVKYYEGDQWSDPVVIKNRLGCERVMTEEEYIKSQGRAALKFNIIHSTIVNIIGQYISAPYTSIVYSSDEGGQDAADAMSNKLDDVKRVNDANVRDARELEKFLNTGCGLYLTSCPWNDTLKAPTPTFQGIDYHRYFRTPDATDIAGKDVDFCGDFIDIPLSEAISIYAKSPSQKQELERIFHTGRSYDVSTRLAFYPKDVETQNIIGTPMEGRCRIIRVCRLEGHWELAVHDYADASWETYRERGNIRRNLDAEISRRRQIAENLGVDYDDGVNRLKLEYEERFVRTWHYYHLSPWGHVLWEQDSPYQHNGHPYVELFYPLLNGHVHGMAFDLLDVEKMLNRMIIMNDFIMSASAKGVLIVDEDSIADDFDLEDIAESWSKFNGVIKIHLKEGARPPEQIVSRQINVGQYDMINLMLGMIKEISGVHDAQRGKAPNAGTPAALYSQEVSNSQMNTLDYLNAFSWFIEQRDYKLIQLIQQFCTQPEYVAAPDGAPEAAKHFDPAEIRRFKFRNKITKSSATAVARLFNERLMAGLLANGMASLQQYQASGAKPFGNELLAKLSQVQQQLSSGQGVSEQQIAQIQAEMPSTPEGMATAAQMVGFGQ